MAPYAPRRPGLGTVVLTREREGRRAAGLTLTRAHQDAQTPPDEPVRYELSTTVLTHGGWRREAHRCTESAHG